MIEHLSKEYLRAVDDERKKDIKRGRRARPLHQLYVSIPQSASNAEQNNRNKKGGKA